VIEPIMYFGLGFLAASLLGLVVMPLVHNRAARLTARRMEASTPLSMAEIQADKDQLRAEFAMSTRRLEISVEQLKAKTTSQLAELGKKTDAINRLKIELGEKTATIFALEAREKALKDQLRTTEEELSLKTSALHEAERSLADRQADLSKATSDLDEQSVNVAGQRIEIVALKTQINALADQVADLQKQVKETEGRLTQERIDADAASKALAAERSKGQNLGVRMAQMETDLEEQTREAGMLSRRVAELESRLADLNRDLAERERERDQLRLDIEAARRVEADLRGELSSIDRRYDTATETLRAEKALVENQLDRAREDRAKLQREIAAMKREAETTWAAERVENALLRERINDVAAEVARLAVTLEGPASPIEAILAQGGSPGIAPLNGGAGAKGAANAPAEEAKGSLADRIRALQARASRLSAS
jgi:chromosome segregation ATPase